MQDVQSVKIDKKSGSLNIVDGNAAVIGRLIAGETMSMAAADSRVCGEVAVMEPDVSEVSWAMEVGEDVQVAGARDELDEGSEGTQCSVERSVEVGASSTSSWWSAAGIDAHAVGSEVQGAVAEGVRSWAGEGRGPVGTTRSVRGEALN